MFTANGKLDIFCNAKFDIFARKRANLICFVSQNEIFGSGIADLGVYPSTSLHSAQDDITL